MAVQLPGAGGDESNVEAWLTVAVIPADATVVSVEVPSQAAVSVDVPRGPTVAAGLAMYPVDTEPFPMQMANESTPELAGTE